MKKETPTMNSTASSPEAIKRQACHAAECESFAELTALLIAERYAKQGRIFEAHRVLRSYLKQHPMTPRVMRKLSALHF